RVPCLVPPVIRDGREVVCPELPDVRRLRLICVGSPPADELVNRAAPLGRFDDALRDQLSSHREDYPLFFAGRTGSMSRLRTAARRCRRPRGATQEDAAGAYVNPVDDPRKK